MNASKLEMQKELREFLVRFGEQIAGLYGTSGTAGLQQNALEESPVWKAVSEMHDYGVAGIPTGDLVPGNTINGAHAQVEAFFRAMDTPPMRLYLEAEDNALPRLAMRAVQTAVARMVLDGGERYTDFAVSEHGLGNGDWGYLTLSEVALLANMDERSVRNAANPKLPDPLKTEAMGKRSLVKPEEARRWLAGRKGFIPTSKGATDDAHRPPHFNYVLTEEEFKDIQREMDNGSSLQAAFLKILSKSER